jgi:hypothetical protein
VAGYSTPRNCPYCGRRFQLGQCPVVATGSVGLATLSRLVQAGELVKDPDGFVVSPARRSGRIESARSGKAFEVEKSAVAEVIDYFGDSRSRESQGEHESAADDSAGSLPWRNGILQKYWLIAAAPEEPAKPQGVVQRLRGVREDIPSATEMSERALPGVRGLRPKRACPHCLYPLPREIDDREVFTVVVAGTTSASKTSFQKELVGDRTAVFLEVEGSFEEFILSEESPRELMELLEEDNTTYRRTSVTDWPEPWVVNVTARTGRPAMLYLYDLAGETFSDSDQRDHGAPFLKWADALIFLVEPRKSGARQALMFQGIMAEMHPAGSVAVVLAKADLVGVGPERVISESEIKDHLSMCGARQVVHVAEAAAANRPAGSVTYHAAAANPGELGTQAPYGVAQAFLAAVKSSDVFRAG